MNICIGVVLYYPTKDNIEKINLYSGDVDKVYIFDNTDDASIKLEKIFKDKQKFEYITYRENQGMSKALNCLCKKAFNDGYDYIITMDQDSIFTSKNIELMKQFILENHNDSIGIVAPKIEFINKKGKYNNKDVSLNGGYDKYEIVDWVITSGSAVNLKNYILINGFDEKYFIDRVDQDYCKRLNENGKLIVLLNNARLYQQLGDGCENILGFYYSEHSPIRNYYIFRNRLYYAKKYMNGLKRIGYCLLGSIRQLLLVILKDKDKYLKLKMMKYGYNDYIQENMYKYSSRKYINGES